MSIFERPQASVKFEATEEQERIWDEMKHGNSNLVVEALAGTGKTTTMVEGLKRWNVGRGKTAFVAFDKRTAMQLKNEVPRGVKACTTHALGLGILNQRFDEVKVEFEKTKRLMDAVGELRGMTYRNWGKGVRPNVRRLVEFCKGENAVAGHRRGRFSEKEGARMDAICQKHDLFLRDRDRMYSTVSEVLWKSKQVVGGVLEVDFGDMIWLPIALNLRMPVVYDLLLCDECVPGWTPVLLADGSSVTIKEIVESDAEVFVRSFDVKTGLSRNCKVVGRQKILNQKPLVKVKVRRTQENGQRKHNFVVCTVDHKLWTVNRGWVMAGKVRLGDTVVVETAAKTTQKGKITKEGRKHLAKLREGNTLGVGGKGGSREQFLKIRKGNGTGFTLGEQVLLDALGTGWVGNYIVDTYKTPGLPNHYKIDLAHVEKRIAVEVDGQTHRQRKEQDRKKTNFLVEQGWTVFRVPNRRAIQKTDEVVCEITGNCPVSAVVVELSEMEIPDSFVYDITVEHCHNFYANGMLVHNCQDLNAVQQQLVLRCGARVIATGDKFQSLYGWRGADTESMENLKKKLGIRINGVDTLPLTTCWRCPDSVIREAQKIVPEIQARPDAPEGSVREVAESVGFACMEPGDLVLCRTNAPLVRLVYELWLEGMPAFIQGRDIGEGLMRLAQSLPATDLESFEMALEHYEEVEADKLERNSERNAGKLIALEDKCGCLQTMLKHAETLSGMYETLETLFSDDDPKGKVHLSSVHRAKGTEAESVMVLSPELMPHHLAIQDWEMVGEENVCYVAVTRAKENLVFLGRKSSLLSD